MLRLGLTGGIGSGKSTVAGMLEQHGAILIDADAISRRVTAAGGKAVQSISETLGAQFVAPDGSLDRVKMRQASFSDKAMRDRLEAIIHPLVGEESDRLESDALRVGARCVVFDIPLLVESRSWRRRVDLVLVVDCLTEVQIQRVMARSGLAREDVERIVASQATRRVRLQAADLVVFNAGTSREQIACEVQQIAQSFGL